MKLSDFIAETVAEISKGVRQAREAEVFPWIAPGHVENKPVWKAKDIQFDIAVTEASGGKGGISVVGFGNIGGETRTETVNRISFSLPVYFEGIGGPD